MIKPEPTVFKVTEFDPWLIVKKPRKDQIIFEKDEPLKSHENKGFVLKF